MKRYNIFYFIGQAFAGFWRNGVMSFASVAVLMSCLVVMGGFALLVANINVNLENFGVLNEIVVFCDYESTDEDVAEIEAKIKKLDHVESVVLVTKEEGLEQMKIENKGIYDDVSEENNPLPDKFVITYTQNEKVTELDYQLKQIEGVIKVNNNLELATSIENVKSGVMLIFTWFLAILAVVSVFIIINTVKLSVFSRRSEISIMRYVGATGWFITLPFLFEGTIIGLVASGGAFLVETVFYHYVENLVLTDLQMITLASYSAIQMPLLWGFLAVGVLCGVIGSSISLGKYLRV
ncbi:MAG: permease-like cell division protein FtsX [Clostridia bacterium]|nr:permease-like cell division protein FtsX [Clostridia bacterium]